MKMKVMLDKGAFMPESGLLSDVGFDLRSPVRVIVPAGRSTAVDTGVHIQLPEKHNAILKSKPGLSIRYGVLSEGVVDPAYTGSILVNLRNYSDKPYTVEIGDKIAQLCIVPSVKPELELVTSL